MSWFSKLKQGIHKSSSSLTEGIKNITVRKKLDDEMCEALEETLIMADMGVETSLSLVADLRKNRFDKDISDEEVRTFLAEKIEAKLTPCAQPFQIVQPENGPFVLLMVGVNGSGKTTTIGKLASQFKAEGKKVVLAAGDTFRAGAVRQLQIWGERLDIDVITPEKEGADPAGVIFKAYEKAKTMGADVLLADTAGRLQNRKELMEELEKIVRVLKKHDSTAPHATLLVLDATVGQNAHTQVEAFKSSADVSGLIITKLDSTAKGGVVVALADKFALPIHYIGIGEKTEDLRTFEANAFAYALMDLEQK